MFLLGFLILSDWRRVACLIIGQICSNSLNRFFLNCCLLFHEGTLQTASSTVIHVLDSAIIRELLITSATFYKLIQWKDFILLINILLQLRQRLPSVFFRARPCMQLLSLSSSPSASSALVTLRTWYPFADKIVLSCVTLFKYIIILKLYKYYLPSIILIILLQLFYNFVILWLF